MVPSFLHFVGGFPNARDYFIFCCDRTIFQHFTSAITMPSKKRRPHSSKTQRQSAECKLSSPAGVDLSSVIVISPENTGIIEVYTAGAIARFGLKQSPVIGIYTDQQSARYRLFQLATLKKWLGYMGARPETLPGMRVSAKARHKRIRIRIRERSQRSPRTLRC